MSVTSRGKRWELLHSLWIGWTFTLGFFNWIAFFYVGLRARRIRWAAWGLLYVVPFTLAMVYATTPAFEGWIGDVTVVLTLVLGVAGIIHAFGIRKEYLLRLEALQNPLRVTERNQKLKGRIATEYAIDGSKEPVVQGAASAGSFSPEATDGSIRGGATTHETAHLPASKPSPTVVGRDTNWTTGTPAYADTAPLEGPSEDRLDYEVASSYPFMLAYGFRLLASKVDHRDRYRDQLRIAENMLAFLASVSLALLKKEDREASGIDLDSYWRSGISPGDWRDIVARCSKVFERYDEGSPASAIRRLNIGSDRKKGSFGAEVSMLISAKNDYKHDRGPTVEEEMIEKSQEVQASLQRCMRALYFFTRYPIRQVEDVNVDRRGDVLLKCLRYTGDHPGLAQEEIIFDKPLRKRDLFLDLGNGQWVELYPFLSIRTCTHCKASETYLIDRWDQRKNVARLKSFERGHTEDSPEVSEALGEWNAVQ